MKLIWEKKKEEEGMAFKTDLKCLYKGMSL